MKLSLQYRVLIINLIIAMALTLMINFSYILYAGEMYMRRGPVFPPHFVAAQMLYFYAMSFIVISLNTVQRLKLVYRIMLTLVVCLFFYLFNPGLDRHGDWYFQFASRRLFDPMLIMKCSFVMSVSILYGAIFDLIYQKQHIVIENEQLKNENLQTRYNMLANQISPHFLFNSLNSLSMLVREEYNDKALVYIDKMSDTFRYMLQTGSNEMTTLEDELAFTEAYLYLHTIRYEDKLFFDIDIDEKYLNWHLPAMSLQPLIENAVKHNSITISNPFRITIKSVGGSLVVSNPIIPKIEDSKGTGIGLKNLASRYQLIVGKDITVVNDGKTFEVILPLIAA